MRRSVRKLTRLLTRREFFLDVDHYNLGMAYFNKGDKEKALAYFIRFKKEYSPLLPPREQNKLDDFIKKLLK
jgi:hypothetical protein